MRHPVRRIAARGVKIKANSVPKTAYPPPPPINAEVQGIVRDIVQVERTAQAALLHCIFGSPPSRLLTPLGPAVKAWNDGLIPLMASAIYEERILPAGILDPQRLVDRSLLT